MTVSLAWVGEGLLYAAALTSFMDLIRPQKRCLTSSVIPDARFSRASPIGQALENLAIRDPEIYLDPRFRGDDTRGVKKRCLTGWFLLLSLSLLMYAHALCDFSFLNVVEHSHTQQPMLYRIAAVWGNHEGSMLLWVTLLGLYQMLACRSLPPELQPSVQLILSCLLLSFIVFMLVACNPFMTVLVPPLQGEGLNPTLQDPSLMIHPPCLYAGYTGMAIPFALALSALIQKQFSPQCRQVMHYWTLIAWTWLTLGLGLGSFWAYYELGWGGWWFWDPVETISLLPWLAATALLHRKASCPEKPTLRLALVGFIFSLMILFFVRSGLLTSVHSFAVDAERGLLLFGILGMVTVGVGVVWFKQEPGARSQKPGQYKFQDFETLCTLLTPGFWLLVPVLLLALIYPLLAEQWGQIVSISPFYFQATFVPLSLPILLGIGFSPWTTRNPMAALTTTLAVWVGLFWWAESISLFGLIILSLSVWVVISHLYFIVTTHLVIPAKAGIQLYFGVSGSRIARFSKARPIWLTQENLTSGMTRGESKVGFKKLSMTLAHLGLGVAVMGMVLSTYGTQHVSLSLTVGDKPLSLNDTGWQVALQQVQTQTGPNYTARQAIINVYDAQGQIVTTLKPERRYFTAAKVIHTEVAFYSTGLSHLYAVLVNDDEAPYTIQIDYKPFINLLWLGILMMVAGGGIAVVNHWHRKTTYQQ